MYVSNAVLQGEEEGVALEDVLDVVFCLGTGH